MSFLRRWFSGLLSSYVGRAIPAGSRVLCVHKDESGQPGHGLSFPAAVLGEVAEQDLAASPQLGTSHSIVLNGTVHYAKDIQSLFETVHAHCASDARMIVIYYSALWRPLLGIAMHLGIRRAQAPRNWVAPEDIGNLLTLSGFELLRRDSRILLPLPIPLLSFICNRLLAPLPLLRALCLVNIAYARPRPRPTPPQAAPAAAPSVSIIVPARNESGNIASLLTRLPRMGPDDEVIFVEGNSTDDTWPVIQAAAAAEALKGNRNIITAQQEGRGKGDAVRKGFALATRDILMILDADLSVAPEELPRFYRVIAEGQGEFVNGSRLVYPMEARAMRFANLLANKAFALCFSFVLGQNFKDTLCGTKVLSRQHYQMIAANRAYFGDFDPFGDFDLLFGAARFTLKIVEVPIHYQERVYGSTNIQRWRHGCMLAAMLLIAARKIKFV